MKVVVKHHRLISFPRQTILQTLTTFCLLTGYFAKPANTTPLQVNTDSCTLGDLNQNGLSYEIADFILFENFFIYGDSVFSTDPIIKNAQICNSDVNQDGLTLRVSDLVSLKRVITGDSPPLPKPTLSMQVADTVYFQIINQGTSLGISYSSTKDIGGVFLRLMVTGTIGTPVPFDSDLVLGYNISPGGLRLLLAPSLDNPDAKLPAGSGPLIYLPFEGDFDTIEFQASTFTGEEMETAVFFEVINDRGDFNLNGLNNEIADLVLYENYFIYGDVVLSSEPNRRQAQIRVSDVNWDGLTLRVADLVFMGRIIAGEINPLPKSVSAPTADSARFQITQMPDHLVVSYDSPIDIGGLFLRLNFLGTAGDPVRLDSAQNMDYGSQVYPGELRFFLASSFSQTPRGKLPAGSGPLLSIPFTGNLRGVEIQTSTFEGLELATAGTFPIDQRGDLNTDGTLSPPDVVQELFCIFQNPSPNCPLALADLNCDGIVSTADLVNILNAAFLGEFLLLCTP